MKEWKATLSRHYENAATDGFPIFSGPEKKSTPFNAAPYVVSYLRFIAQASVWPGRGGLVQALQACFAEAQSLQLTVDAMLIGGSFLDLANPAPKDIDCVWLYRSMCGNGADVALLMSLQKRFKQQGIDMRFVPLDIDLMLLVKPLCFFSILYAKKTGENSLNRAPVLVDCATVADPHAVMAPALLGAL